MLADMLQVYQETTSTDSPQTLVPRVRVRGCNLPRSATCVSQVQTRLLVNSRAIGSLHRSIPGSV